MAGYFKLIEQIEQDFYEYGQGGYIEGKLFGFGVDVVEYRRGWNKVERWQDDYRTHIFRTKIPYHQWEGIILKARENALDKNKREQMEEYGVDYPNLLRELDIDIHDWDSRVFDIDNKRLRFSDPLDDFCVYIWTPHGINRLEDGNITHHFAVTIPEDEWLAIATIEADA